VDRPHLPGTQRQVEGAVAQGVERLLLGELGDGVPVPGSLSHCRVERSVADLRGPLLRRFFREQQQLPPVPGAEEDDHQGGEQDEALLLHGIPGVRKTNEGRRTALYVLRPSSPVLYITSGRRANGRPENSPARGSRRS